MQRNKFIRENLLFQNKNESFYLINKRINKDLSKAIFFDRDGVIIKDKHYLNSSKDVELEKDVVKFLRLTKSRGWLNIFITNQSGIQRNILNWEEYKYITERMVNLIGEDLIDGIYANSHIQIDSYNWRKPNPFMILEAKKHFKLNLKESIIFGDRLTDLIAGEKAGLKTGIHLQTGHGNDERKMVIEYFKYKKMNFELMLFQDFEDTLNKLSFPDLAKQK